MSDDPAHVLFPSDAPAASKPPDWYVVRQNAAEARLSGRHATTQDDAAARLFPSDAAKTGAPAQHTPPAGKTEADQAAALFKNDAPGFNDKPVTDFFDGFAISATADGDIARGHALQAAGKAIIADAKENGTDAADLAEALDIVKERQSDTIQELSAERMEAEFAAGMATLTAEGVTASDLDAARAFIRDLESVSPGVIDTLERTSAGNDPRLIRKAIAEARRRGY